MHRGTGYTPRGRGGFTSRGGYTPRGRGGSTSRGGRQQQSYRDDNSSPRQQSYRDDDSSRQQSYRRDDEDEFNTPKYESNGARPERYYEQKTRAARGNPYRRIGPARKHPLPPPIKMDVPEVVKEAHEGFDEEKYPPPDPSKRKNKDKYDPEKRKLLKKNIKERKHYVDTKKETRKAIRDEKKAVKNEERKEKIQKQKETVQQYVKEHENDDDFVKRRKAILGPIDDLKKELEEKAKEPKKEPILIGKNPIRNQKFIKNARCPITGKFVKEIWRKKITKIGREKWDLVWQYYRDRNRESVLSKFKKLKDLEIEVVYFSDPEEPPSRFIVPQIDIEEEQPDTRASKKAKLIKLRKIQYNLEVRFAGTKGYISPPDKIKLENRIQFMKEKIEKFEAHIQKLNQMYGHQTEYDQDVIKKLLEGVSIVKTDNIQYTNNKSEIVKVGDVEQVAPLSTVPVVKNEDDDHTDDEDDQDNNEDGHDDESISVDDGESDDDGDSKMSTDD